jgi:hypothetical protein
VPIDDQIRELRHGVDFFVGTTGRVLDHINRGNFDFSSLKTVILDETDQMLKQGHPRLVGQFGPALLDKAIADAVLRSQNQSWVSGLGQGLLGDPWSGTLKLHTANSVWLRHTVGLADRLTDAEALTAAEDGLPNSLTQAIEAYGLKYFKLKVGGNLEADI